MGSFVCAARKTKRILNLIIILFFFFFGFFGGGGGGIIGEFLGG